MPVIKFIARQGDVLIFEAPKKIKELEEEKGTLETEQSNPTEPANQEVKT